MTKAGTPEPANREAVRQAQFLIDGVPGVESPGALSWNPDSGHWVIPLTLVTETADASRVPARTNWFLLADAEFPYGRVSINPAKDGGLQTTFQHQSLNEMGKPELPWQSGDICFRGHTGTLPRAANDPEPKGSIHRLAWCVRQAQAWLRDASADALIGNGDPYELPAFPLNKPLIAFNENPSDLERWRQYTVHSGVAELVTCASSGVLAVKSFSDFKHRPLHRVEWGTAIDAGRSSVPAAWIRLSKPPLAEHYRPAMTWGELRNIIDADGLVPDDELRQVATEIRTNGQGMLLIGWPVPQVFGGPPVRMHWQAIHVRLRPPTLQTKGGFRHREDSQWRRDRSVELRNSERLNWCETRNWAADQLATRGRFSLQLCDRRVLLIGAGSLGSSIAELLVRSGVHDLHVIDSDTLAAGNLARHVLTLDDIGQNKSERLAQRLNRLSPHARVIAHPGSVRFAESLSVIAHDRNLIIETTGDNHVLAVLAQQELSQHVRYVSASISALVRHIYVFLADGSRFPMDSFQSDLRPWSEAMANVPEANEFPHEGIGCFHPVFPARSDDMWRAAAQCVRTIDQSIASSFVIPRLFVYDGTSDLPDLNASTPARNEEAA